MPGALEGIRVIDFGQYIAGPLAAMMLGDQGAEVIRVDPPSGPRWQTPANASWNRGKRSIALDLKTPEGVETARRLIATADIVVENFRPGVMDRLGLGADAMREANPALIYCSLPGFAHDDPRRGVAAWEGVVGAATAYYHGRGATDGNPTHFSAIPLASNFAAFTAVNSITAALIARERMGRGQRIETALFNAMYEAFGARAQRNLATADGSPPPPATPPGGPDPLGGGHYQASDGRWMQLIFLRPRHFTWFADKLFPDDWKAAGLDDPARLRSDPAHRDELRQRLAALFRTRTAAEWQQYVNEEVGTPLCIAQTTAEWLQDPHARATRSVVTVDDAEYGPMSQPGFPVQLHGTPAPDPEPRHALDADRDAILAELDSRPAPATREDGERLASALDGIRVVDTTQIWAGPTAGRVLAEFGADVIKINDTSNPVASHEHVNSGKRTLLLDLQSEAGLNVLWRLLEDTDVFTENSRKGTADRMGIGYEALRARKPDIVYASVTAYGHDGPRGDHRGWEPVGQAASGMQARMGGDGVPMLQPYAVCDYGTGMMGAFAVLLGLFHRARTGQGQRVEAALSMTGTFHQTPFMYDYEGRSWEGEPAGPDAKGFGPLQRLYEASDGWFFLGTRRSELPRLAEVLSLDGLASLDDAALEARLTEAFAGGTVAEWTSRLVEAGIGAHALVPFESLLEDQWAKDRGLVVVREFESLGPVLLPGPSPRLSETPVRVAFPARKPGADAPEVLSTLGLSDELDGLVKDRVLALPTA